MEGTIAILVIGLFLVLSLLLVSFLIYHAATTSKLLDRVMAHSLDDLVDAEVKRKKVEFPEKTGIRL